MTVVPTNITKKGAVKLSRVIELDCPRCPRSLVCFSVSRVLEAFKKEWVSVKVCASCHSLEVVSQRDAIISVEQCIPCKITKESMPELRMALERADYELILRWLGVDKCGTAVDCCVLCDFSRGPLYPRAAFKYIGNYLGIP